MAMMMGEPSMEKGTQGWSTGVRRERGSAVLFLVLVAAAALVGPAWAQYGAVPPLQISFAYSTQLADVGASSPNLMLWSSPTGSISGSSTWISAVTNYHVNSGGCNIPSSGAQPWWSVWPATACGWGCSNIGCPSDTVITVDYECQAGNVWTSDGKETSGMDMVRMLAYAINASYAQLVKHAPGTFTRSRNDVMQCTVGRVPMCTQGGGGTAYRIPMRMRATLTDANGVQLPPYCNVYVSGQQTSTSDGCGGWSPALQSLAGLVPTIGGVAKTVVSISCGA